MKITNVRAVQPIAAGSPPDWRTSLGQILVAIDTDAGLTGYGVGGGGLAGVHVVRTVLRDLLLDREPEPIDGLWRAMYEATLPFGRKGIAIMAISGVDLALWDLRGKAAGCPVAELLGGSVHRPIPTYVTVWGAVPPEVTGKHQAFKLHVEPADGSDPVSAAVGFVERSRQVVGPGCPLMIDAWMKWTVATTLTVAEQVREYNLAWIEEPLPADDFAGYALLSERCPIPIAGGEHEFTAVAFADLIDRRLHRVLQPDVCWCGGMTELVKIYALARQAGLRVCPHRGAELWGLHALAALDPEPLAKSGRPWMTWVGVLFAFSAALRFADQWSRYGKAARRSRAA
jgi:L-rhamnonate dehydratase